MPPDPYIALAVALDAAGLTGHRVRTDQLVVAARRWPALPNEGNSFWLSWQLGAWHLITWSPACYRLPTSQNVVEVCLACMKIGTSAMYRIPDEIMARFSLEQISENDFDRMFPESGGSASPGI